MSEQDQTASQTAPEADRLEQLEAENESLRRQLEALQAAEEDRQTQAERLRQQAEANQRLRKELAAKALSEAIRAAAGEVGIDVDLALLQAHRFDCQVDDNGVVRIEPNPTETLLKLSKTDPLFRRVNSAVKERRRRRAALDRATAVDESDPVDLIAYLDRNPARRYEFIRRHGREKFFELLRTAKRRGYRRVGI